MDASGGNSRTDFPELLRQPMFDAARLAIKQCRYWSAVVTSERSPQPREEGKRSVVCRIEHMLARRWYRSICLKRL
jgi:hypothetical protein